MCLISVWSARFCCNNRLSYTVFLPLGIGRSNLHSALPICWMSHRLLACRVSYTCSLHTLQRAGVACTGHTVTSVCHAEPESFSNSLPGIPSGCASHSAVPASGCRPCVSGKGPKLLERHKNPTITHTHTLTLLEGTGAIRAEGSRP